MRSLFLLIFIILISPRPTQDLDHTSSLIIWNVGQGQWITWSDSEKCLHFDTGGESVPWNQILKLCWLKTNYIYLSHKDRDHSQWANQLYHLMPKKTCLFNPLTKNPEFIYHAQAPSCTTERKTTELQRWIPPETKYLKNTNYHSEIFLFKKFLLPGDSIMAAEKSWVNKISIPHRIKVLILGHHGSKTSTSTKLLNALPLLSQCISSSRKIKYGHPHQETLARLKKKKCPHLNTEKWGHIHFIYN